MTTTPRGQGATEYLVLLAAVLIVAMVVVSLVSSMLQISPTQSVNWSYWSSLAPFAISDASQAGQNHASLSIQNTGSRELTMNALILSTEDGLHSYTNDTATVFRPGQKRVMNVTLDANVVDCALYTGKTPNSYSVFIRYDDDPITGKVFNSTNKLLSPLCSS